MGGDDRRRARQATTPDDAGDAALFREAAAGAIPLRDARGFVPAGQKPSAPGRSAPPDEPAPALDLDAAGDRVEAALRGLDARTRRRLRRGEIAIEARLDLHGLNRSDAERAVARFIASASGGGRRCVLVVHGRGLNSKGGSPVLKEAIGGWLARGSERGPVLAFCPARPRDGGEGALYVLLRRAGKV
jgi:DNA-nicking Smr family endonuclease